MQLRESLVRARDATRTTAPADAADAAEIARSVDCLDVIEQAAPEIERLCAAQRVELPPYPAGSVDAVLPFLEELLGAVRLAVARSRHIVLPNPLARAFADVRAGRLADPPRPALGAASRTFSVAGIDARFWDLATPGGEFKYTDEQGARVGEHAQLVLPTQEGQTKPTAKNAGAFARATLTPAMVRTYCATWWLSERWDAAHPGFARLGNFALDTRAVLCDLYGLPMHARTTADGTFDRPPTSAESEFLRQFHALESIFLRGVGTGKDRLEPRDPERLVTYVRGQGGQRVYHHAHLAMLMMRGAFLQLPMAALTLEPRHAPMALGLASLWRDCIVRDVLDGAGAHRTRLRVLAERIGEDCAAGARRDGRAYWSTLALRVGHVVKAGDLGDVVIGGEGPDAHVTLTPTVDLASVYGPLRQAGAARRERAHAIDLEVDVRRRLPAGRSSRRGSTGAAASN